MPTLVDLIYAKRRTKKLLLDEYDETERYSGRHAYPFYDNRAAQAKRHHSQYLGGGAMRTA